MTSWTKKCSGHGRPGRSASYAPVHCIHILALMKAHRPNISHLFKYHNLAKYVEEDCCEDSSTGI